MATTIETILGTDTSQAETTPTVAATTTQQQGQQQQQQQQPPAEPLSLADLYKKLNPYTPPSEEELAKEKKKQKRGQVFAAIGDGISALSNLYFTTQYAPNMYTGKNTASERTQIRYDKLQRERKENNANYFNGLIKAMGADDQERNWRRTLEKDAQEQKRYDDNLAHRDKREKIADDRYDDDKEYKRTRDGLGDEWKQKEFDQREKQYGRQNALAWANHNLSKQTRADNKEIREKQIKAAGAKAVRGKQLGFADGQGNQMSIYENVWKGSMQQVYDTLLSEIAPTDEKERAGWDRQMKKNDTPQKKEDFVKQNWHKSPKASQIMLTLSTLDPATMTSELNDDDDFSQYQEGDDDDFSQYKQ